MEAKSRSQILLSLILLSVFYSQTLALPLGTYSTMRLGNDMLFDDPNGPDQNLDFLKVENDNLEHSLSENGLSFFDAPRAMNRIGRHADGLFTSDYSKLLGQLSAKKYLESIVGKRVRNNLEEEDHGLFKRQADAIFTDLYSRHLQKIALQNYLNSILNNKRSEDAEAKS